MSETSEHEETGPEEEHHHEAPAPVAQVIGDGGADPLEDMRHEQVRSLADSFALHAELLREQREHTGELTSLTAGVRDSLADLREAIREFREFVTTEKARHEDEKPLLHSKADSSWGELGY